jgi:hypothetical protein
MAQVPLPERGQPLDVTYIYQLAEAINSISNQVTSATYNYTTIDSGTGSPQSVKTSDAKFVGGYKQVTTNTTVGVGQEVGESYTYPEFKYPPVITATISNISGTAAGTDATVILKSVTTTRVDFIVKFKTGGVSSVGVNIIAIGVTN